MATTTLTGRTARLSRGLSIVLALLMISAFINYLDRGNLSIAAPMLEDELGISPAKLGVLLSSFFWSYGCFQILSGWLIDRYNAGWIMAGGFLLWSAATSITGFLHTFAALILVRTVLGAGESVAYPAYARIFSVHFPPSHRSVANAVIASGLSLGPAFGMLFGGTLMARFGWRPFFICLGLVSLVWLIPWVRYMPAESSHAESHAQAPSSGHAPATIEVLRHPAAWATFVSSFFSLHLLYFMLTWLPFYLVRERHFSLYAMARIGGAVYIAQALGCVACGRISDRVLARGASQTRVRKGFIAGSLFSTGTCLFAAVLAGPRTSIALLILAGFTYGFYLATQWPCTQVLAGPQAAGRWTGIQCFFGNASGVVAPAVAGLLVNRTGHFVYAFAFTTGVTYLAALLWLFVVGKIEPIQWPDRQNIFSTATMVE